MLFLSWLYIQVGLVLHPFLNRNMPLIVQGHPKCVPLYQSVLLWLYLSGQICRA